MHISDSLKFSQSNYSILRSWYLAERRGSDIKDYYTWASEVQEKVEKVLEERERLAQRSPTPKRGTQELLLRASPSQPSAGLPGEEVSREFHHSSMMTPDKCSRDSSRASSETPSPTLNTLAEKLWLRWTSSTHSSAKAGPSMVSEVDCRSSHYAYLSKLAQYSNTWPLSLPSYSFFELFVLLFIVVLNIRWFYDTFLWKECIMRK